MVTRPVVTARCRPMAAGESRSVAALVRRVFNTCVAPECSIAGRRAFLAYARPVRIRERLDCGHSVLVAMIEGRLAGMIEVRGEAHIAMLFVESDAQRHGVARALIEAAFAGKRANGPDETTRATITVNATPGSIAAYARLGFHATGPERDVDSLRVVPMARLRAGHRRRAATR
jgi:GNAT superfamily N-acetyltransferase